MGLMRRKDSGSDLYATYGGSVAQRVAITTAVGACVGLAWWLLFGAGSDWLAPGLEDRGRPAMKQDACASR